MKNKNLVKFLNESKISIPSYQRVYTWEKNEISMFIDDLKVDIFKERITNIGVVYYETSESSDLEYHIIDGQQRITTSSIILITLSSLISSKELKDFVTNFYDKKVFRSSIKQLDDIYQGLYKFLKFFIDANYSFEDALKKFNQYAIENDINTWKNNDLIYALKLAHDILLTNKKSELATLYKQIQTIEFIMLSNPYEDDPITIFERLNNRGKELSFISLSKVSVYQYFNRKLKNEGVDDHENLSTEFMEIYSETLNSVFFSSHTNFKMENRDKFLETTLRSYLSVKAGKIISSNRADLLEALETFIDKEVEIYYASKKERLTTILSLFKEYLFFASISLVYKSCQNSKDSSKKKLVNAYYLNDKLVDKRFDSLKTKPDSEFSKNLSMTFKLKEINLEKFKDLIIYVLTLSTIRKDLFSEKAIERRSTVSQITKGLVKWTNINWVNFTKVDIDETTFREEMKLSDFIHALLTIPDSRTKMKKFNKHIKKENKEEFNAKNWELVKDAVDNNHSITDKKRALIIKKLQLANQKI